MGRIRSKAKLHQHISARKRLGNVGRRLRRVTLKLVGASVYYGLMLTLGMYESKSLLCWLSRTYLKTIDVSEFLILFGLFSFIFMLLNCLVVKMATAMMYPKYYLRKSRSLLYPNYRDPKYTRSGVIYGYM